MRAVATTMLLLAGVLATQGCKQVSTRGPNNEEVTAVTPRSVSVKRGDSVPFQVKIDRENFTGPVTVSLSQLPKGVDADRNSMTVESDTATFVLKAAKTADLVKNQAVGVTIEAGDGRKAKQYMELTVMQ